MKPNAIPAVIALLLGVVFMVSMGAWFLRDHRRKFTPGPSATSVGTENRGSVERAEDKQYEEWLKKGSRPLPLAEAPGDDWLTRPNGPPLLFPAAEILVSAEFHSWREGGDWKHVSLDDAKVLVTALAGNQQFFRPANVICVLFAPPTWVFKFAWSDRVLMTVEVTDGGWITGVRKTVNGVADGIGGRYKVTGGSCDDLVNRCVGRGASAAPEKPQEPEAPK